MEDQKMKISLKLSIYVKCTFPKAISKKQFLFQLQMVISPLFCMAYPRLIPEKIERDD